MDPRARRVLMVAIFGAALTGCGGGKLDVTVDVHPAQWVSKDGEADVIEVAVRAKDILKTRIKTIDIVGKEPVDRGYEKSSFAAESFPIGTTKVKVKLVGETRNALRKWSKAELVVDADVVRSPLKPRARVTGGSAISGGCGNDRVCVNAPSIDITTGKVDLSVYAPTGTKVEVLGRSLVGKGMNTAAPAAFDLSREVLASSVEGGRVPITVKVTSPDGVTETKSSSMEVAAISVRTALDKVKTGPVRFANEPGTVGPSRVVAFKRSSSTTFHGKGTLPELELVAFAQTLPARNQSCGTYVGQTTGRRVTITNSAYDEEVIVYERKTGRIRTRRTFRAPMPSCTSSTTSASGSGGSVASKDLVAYVETLVGR